MLDKEKYLEVLKEKTRERRVTKSFQYVGLTLAHLLQDKKHKSFYISLAKNISHQKLIALAKDITQRTRVKNPGAYFVKILKEKGILKKNLCSKKKSKKSGQLKIPFKKRG